MLSDALKSATERRLGMRESVTLLAALMAINALGIDAMIAALPDIGRTLRIASENQRQLVVIVYMIGFGAGQLLWGPLGDRYGRRPTLAAGIGCYIVFATICAFARSLPLMLLARLLMGGAAASSRVLVTAIVRDMFQREQMARVMSLVAMTFMVVPVLAPSIGQAVLLVAPWQAIFLLLAGYAAVMLVWSQWRLPETLHPEYRRSLEPGDIAEAARIFFADRLAVGYTLAISALLGALSSYIASIQQIVFDVFRAPQHLALVFGAVAAPMALAAWMNSRIVGRFGLRRVGHCGLIGFVAFSMLHWLIAETGHETIVSFVVIMGLVMVSFGLCSANFTTLAMSNMGPVAGTASSIQGVMSTVIGAVIGAAVGQAFDGTVLPFLTGYAACGIAALLIVVRTEHGRLLRPASGADDTALDPSLP